MTIYSVPTPIIYRAYTAYQTYRPFSLMKVLFLVNRKICLLRILSELGLITSIVRQGVVVARQIRLENTVIYLSTDPWEFKLWNFLEVFIRAAMYINIFLALVVIIIIFSYFSHLPFHVSRGRITTRKSSHRCHDARVM